MGKFKMYKKVLSFRRFDRLNSSFYTTYDIAWPVEVIECLANKVSDGLLNTLEEAVLELLTVPEMSLKRIAQILGVGDELVDEVVSELTKREPSFYDAVKREVTIEGKEYIQKKETGEFQEEKVFGNMFVSRINGEVFPFFAIGKLPWGREYEDILYLSFDEEEESTLEGNQVNVLDKVNRAFHLYGRITKTSKEQSREHKEYNMVDFIEDELKDQSFRGEETLAEVEENKKLENARIKILDTRHKEIYIRTRLVVKKDAPDKYIIESPFPENITSWYSQNFHRLIVNKEFLYFGDEEIGIGDFCENTVTRQFYIDFPEMLSNSFEQYVKIYFPRMFSCSISETCLEKAREVFNCRLLCEKGEIKRHVVITEATKAIELILNNYIARTNRDDVVEKYKRNVRTFREVEDFFDEFLLGDCSARKRERQHVKNGTLFFDSSCMSHFRRGRNGNSVMEKYHYLIAEASYNSNSKFRKLLLTEGTEIIECLDFINTKRNKFGAHNDGTEIAEISNEDYVKFEECYRKATRILLDYID